MSLFYVIVYVVSLVVSWYFVNYFADEEDTNLSIYVCKLICLTPVFNIAVALALSMFYLDEEKHVFDSLGKHLADKPFKRKQK